MKKIVVIGGGLTGLVSAYFASRAGFEVVVLESSDKMGGLLATFKIGDTRLEKFYHHFFTHDTELIWLLAELGISDRLVFHNSTMGIFSRGKIYNLNGSLDLLGMDCLSIEDKIRFGLTSVYLYKFADWRKNENVPIYDWFLKFAGKNTTKVIWEPLLKAKFGPYYTTVPVSWMIGRLSQRVSSRKGAKEKLGYLQGSTDTLLKALTTKVTNRGVKLVTNAEVKKLNVQDNKLVSVETPAGSFSADSFMSTVPTTTLSNLVKTADQKYAELLSRINYFGAMCLIYELSESLDTVYWLNIAEEGFSFGGVIEHTNLVSADNYAESRIVYLSRYFSRQEKIAQMDEEQVKTLMFTDLKRVYPKLTESMIKNTYLFKTDAAATVCDLNFSHKVPACKTPIENLFAVNMAHIYPDERSCNNSIRTAAKACQVAGIDTSYVPNGRSLSGLIGMQ